MLEDAGSCIALLIDRRTGDEFNISRYAISIGRELGNDLAIVADKTISRQHAQIQFMDGEFHLQDLNSKNGTRLNGKKITRLAQLQSGDEICLGLTQLIFLLIPQTGVPAVQSVKTETIVDPVVPRVVAAR